MFGVQIYCIKPGRSVIKFLWIKFFAPFISTVLADEAAGSSEEDFSGGEVEVQECRQTTEDQELKDKLFRKYSGYISTLKHEFSKTKKKGKLPKEARQALLDWWNIHYKWPYPTVKICL